jgi:ATP-binding cassette subfamily F protein 3
MLLLRLDGVARSIGPRTLFHDVSFGVAAGDRVGLIGPNGAGKTTLLRIASGEEAPDAGSVGSPRHVRVARLRQEIDPGRPLTVRQEVTAVQAGLAALEQELRGLEADMAAAGERGADIAAGLAERYDRVAAAFAFGGGFEREARVESVLHGLGFSAAQIDRPLRELSGGWLMRVELAKLLLAAPDVLLLDEPTNHLDLPSIEWFEQTLADYRGGVVVVSHDRTFLRRHATRIAELEGGGCTVFEGGYDRYLDARAFRREQLLARQKNLARQAAQTERFVERFRYKASKARQVQSRIKALSRMERVEVAPDRRAAPRLRIPPPARAGESVLSIESLHKRYGDKVVYAGVDFDIRRGERVALAGPNGAGKSTLLRIAAGVLDFDEGERRLGHNVTPAFYAQHQLEVLDPERTVLEELETAATTGDVPRLRGHLGAFLFSGDDVDKRVCVLSGGEKARLALAKMLLRPANFLILDEPTNHLDVAACEVLEQALAGYAGTLLFISHDRAFIDALATRVVDVRGGVLRSFPGNHADYERGLQRGAPAQVEAAGSIAPPPPAAKAERSAARERARADARRQRSASRRLAGVEAAILELEEELEALTHQLALPEVYRDGDLVRQVEGERAEVRTRIQALYAEWESAAEEVEG